MEIRITNGKGWYRNCVGEIFKVVERHPSRAAYYVKFWDGEEYITNQFFVSDGNYEIVDEEVTVDSSQASEQVIEMLANLVRRVTSLERQLADTQRNLERQAEELENAKHRISKHATMFGAVEEKVEMLTDDVITLDERTQVVNAITKFYEEGRR
jgi:hypothetical protein